jgi:hypothetical protein
MPKRGSSTSGTVAAVPRKKSRKVESTNGHDDEEQNENISIDHSYSTQSFKKSPDVNISFSKGNLIHINSFLAS